MFAPQIMGSLPMQNQPLSPYMPQSPNMMTNPHSLPDMRRSNSLTWRAESGLPPPPSEIDQFPDIQRHLIAQNGDDLRSQSPSRMAMPSTTETMPMHAVTKHPKLKLKILMAKEIFQAGETVSGILEITSSTSQRLRLGEIAIELEAFEELSSRDHSATQIFLFNRTLFQGEHLPPSNAVLPSAPVQGHWTARKGRTTFPFSFRLPASAPSSVIFAGNANLHYSVKGTVQTWWNENKSLVTVRSEALVVERWEDEYHPKYLEPVEMIADTHVFMGGNGAIWLEAALAEQLFAAGNAMMIRAGVKNNSKRQMSGMKVIIVRRLIFPVSGPPGKPAVRPSLEPQITEEVYSQVFRGSAYEFPPNEEVVVNLAVDIPRDIRTIRKTRLFEVHTLVIVSLQMGSFAKDLQVEIPIFVAHPSSLQRRTVKPIERLQDLPQRSRSAMAQHGQHQFCQPQQQGLMSMPTPVASPLLQDPAQQYMWSPAPPLSRPASAAANIGSNNNANPPQPFSFVPAGNGQGQQIVWNADAQAWTASAILANVTPIIRPISAQDMPVRSQSAAPAMTQDHVAPSQPKVQSFGQGQPMRRYSAPSDAPSPATAGGQTEQKHSQKPQNQTSSALIPSPTAQSITAAQQQATYDHNQQPLQVPFCPSPSQLLGANAQPLGLATIEEDSESAAGTVRSIRTLIGSVTRGDIDQFEQMAQKAEDEEEMRKAMRKVGMVPDERQFRMQEPSRSVQELPNLPQRKKPQQSIVQQQNVETSPIADKNKSLPTAPLPQKSSKTESKTNTKPRVSDIFNVAKQTEDSIQQQQQQPIRPSSAQGIGLLALENRLNTPVPSAIVDTNKKAVNGGRKSEPSPSKVQSNLPDTVAMANVRRRSTSGSLVESSVNRTASKAAEEREQRAREDELSRKKHEEQRKTDEARRKAKQDALLASTVSVTKNVSQKKERTTSTNLQLSTNVSSSTTSFEKNQGERKAVDMNEQRKLNKEAVGRVAGWLSTSPSREVGTSGLQDGSQADPTLSPKTPSPSVLLNGVKTLAEVKNSTSTIALRTLFDRQDQTGALSKQAPVHSRPSKSLENDQTSSKKDAETTNSDIPASIIKSLVKHEQNEPTTTSAHYDVRSARGGRGGRVASVASMWTSIAEGTDGTDGKDQKPVLTLKPKAIRTGAALVLDFSKAGEVKKLQKGEEKSVQKPVAQIRPPLIVNNRVKSLAPKTNGAPHFINTTIPKAIFSATDTNVANSTQQNAIIKKGEIPPPARKLNSQENVGNTRKVDANQVVISKEGKLKATRKITSDLIAAEARMQAGRDLAKDAEDALLLPMNGRGTTKPIGREKLADLRSLWGN